MYSLSSGLEGAFTLADAVAGECLGTYRNTRTATHTLLTFRTHDVKSPDSISHIQSYP